MPQYVRVVRFSRLERDHFDFNYFTASNKPVKVFGKYHANYHVAAQENLYGTAHNVFYFTKRLAWKATEQDVQRIDAAYVKRITDDFCKATCLVLGTAAVSLGRLFAALGTEVARCSKRDSSASRMPEPHLPLRAENKHGPNIGQAGDLFVANPLQKAILAALNGQALMKQGLADAVAKGDGGALYRHGDLKELRERGLVAHKPRVGFYRPDAPPDDE